ncbi:hypothetical protein EMIHUDRAFT_444913 [Emiliania huxleyi CCMP1516]|uniref:Glycosyltransferase family 92 protein n=2 Tax=Emiliania huxleyi TaxID=2903 RepID=A0A0D3J738_EMIH1|nr:hypothetical protein EMIHUDRAFT_444913 [Emiliania huxleyi CCMP1516]EOD19323.1 hypothetical protein EMIHUDRAFT_444913 [Emiliania huxleyi CCMP1516]|eukprot:XP_005771752.1 hypothetical protein EMIHUDRAFT_444913 [Emiliania huxleyi CCMP1516]
MTFWVHAPTTTDANGVDDPRANATAAAAAAAEHSLHAEGVDDVRRISSRWSDKLMLNVTNDFIKALPRDRWLVFANIDEFFYFPCDMQRRIAERKTTFCADMEDRVAQSRRAVELREAPPIDEQFPVRCRIRQSLRSRGQRPITTEKITLFLASPAGRPHRQYKSPHRLFSQYGKLGRCNNTGSFSHYTATTMYVQAIEKKLRNFRWNPTVEMDYRSQLKLLRADAPLC